MESIGAVLRTPLWFVGVLLVALAVLRLIRYDARKPWLMMRTKAGPLPLRAYVAVTALIVLGLLIAALIR